MIFDKFLKRNRRAEDDVNPKPEGNLNPDSNPNEAPSCEDNMVYQYKPNQCGNCHQYLKEGDMYCRYCGTKRGMGEFLPYLNIMSCIYGPRPEKRIHVCEKCQFRWETEMMIDEQQYCPMCGGPAPIFDEALASGKVKAYLIEWGGMRVALEQSTFLGKHFVEVVDETDTSDDVLYAKIIFEDDLAFIKDLGSDHGVILNDRRLEPFEKTPIVSGDSIQFADTGYICEVKM